MARIDCRSAYGARRVTPQRMVIADAAAAIDGSFTVDSLAAAAHALDASIGVATVYRAVTAMLQSGWLERVGERKGRSLYTRCEAGSHHHHHVVCDECGRVEVAECPVAVSPGLETESGFVLTRHEVTLYGLCPKCVEQRKKPV